MQHSNAIALLSIGLFGSGINLTGTGWFNDNSFLALLRMFWYSSFLVVPMHLKVIVCSITGLLVSHLLASESVSECSDVLLKRLWSLGSGASSPPLCSSPLSLSLLLRSVTSSSSSRHLVSAKSWKSHMMSIPRSFQ